MAASRKRKDGLTELEGAILSAVRRGEGITPYRLRQAFLVSPSIEWSGSAGAVYPAMRRLKAAGLLSATTSGDARGTEHYRVTEAGEAALLAWAGDVERAMSVGIDPFRSRVPQWLILPSARRGAMLRALEKALTARCEALRAKMPTVGEIDRVQVTLELELQRTRLRWIAANK
jgi:DNA-binding PadR family transcriptional regulator